MYAAKWFLSTLLVGLAVGEGEDRQPSAQPSDITSINGLQVKRGPVDPKLRKALLRVLNRIKEEEHGQLPADLPEEDFIRVIGEPARSEDLGSFEVNDEQAADPNFPYEEALNFGKKLIGGRAENNDGQNESNKSDKEPQFQGYFASQPGPETDISQTEGGNYFYDRPLSGRFGSSEENDAENKSNDNGVLEETTSEDHETTTYPNEITIISSANGGSKTSPSNHSVEENESTDQSKERSTEDFKKYDTEQTLPDDGVSTDSVSSTDRQGLEEVTEPAVDDSSEVNPLENYIRTRAADNLVQVTAEESNIVNSNHSYSSKYSSERSTSGFLPTKPSVDVEESYDPTSPTEQSASDVTLREVIKSKKSSGDKITEANKDEDKDKKKNEKIKHIVEFAPSPLITAFTVQQDDKGVPHRVIPLDYINPTKPPATTEDPEIVAQRQRELEEKEFILQQQLRSLQQEKFKYTGEPKPNHDETLRLQREEELRRQQEILLQQFQQLTPQLPLQQPQLTPQQLFQQPHQQFHLHQLTPQQQFQQPSLVNNQQFQQPQVSAQLRHIQQLPQQHSINQRPHQQSIQQIPQKPQNQPYRQIQPLVQTSVHQTTQLYQRQQLQPNQQQFQNQPPQQGIFNQQNSQRQPYIQQSKALSPEEFLKQQEYIRYQQNYQRQQELYRQQELQKQQEFLRRQQLERQRFNQGFPFISNQNLELHKSIDFRLPLFDHNRVHRNEPPYFVNNFGFNQPVTISGQIQSLISQSGISSGLPKNTQTDLSIVSKILALDYEHKGNEPRNNIKRQLPEVSALRHQS